jgi:hypothetical protein
MSCITEILKVKADKDFLPIERNGKAMMLGVEGGGHHKGYEYLITFNDMGFRCGYVVLPVDHKFYDNNFMDDDEELHVHGGITFHEQHHLVEDVLGKQCTDKWIGFDAGHGFDIVDLQCVKKYFPDLREARLDHVISMAHLFERHGDDAAIRTFDYMEEQCKYLIDQLVEKEAA